jgi:Stage II sporulation protein E (SpoIIE)
MDVRAPMDDADATLGRALIELYRVANILPPASVAKIVDVVCEMVGARAGRLLVADYGLQSLRELGPDGPVGETMMIEGTVAGRVFADGAMVASGEGPTVLHVPLIDGTERVGLLALDFDVWDGVPFVLEPLVVVLVSLLVAKSRYTDAWVRCRRAQPLTAAAEVQWGLLPPLAASATDIAVAGIVEPAYAIGGDSFDYAMNVGGLDFAIIDAMGRGMSAVLMAAAAINGLRNVRREGGQLVDGYVQVDRLIARHFGDFSFVTGQFGSLNAESGILRWINAGHPAPLLVRNGTFAGELACEPSMPMGLGGTVVQVAEEALQGGDRVLFYTDGITESRSLEGESFGTERLADYLVRATLDRVPAAETVRRLSANVLAFVGVGLRDDATLFLVEYRVDQPPHPGSA